MSNDRIGDWMQLYPSGRAYWPLDPSADDVDVRDIAHHLSMVCRFGGGVSRFYSVAEHSVHVSYVVERQGVERDFVLQALLHDATEAYLGDMVRPLKQNMLKYQLVEQDNWSVIADRFDVPRTMHPSVKCADNAVLLAERNELLPPPPIPWTWAEGLEPANVKILAMDPTSAEDAFLRRFDELTN